MTSPAAKRCFLVTTGTSLAEKRWEILLAKPKEPSSSELALDDASYRDHVAKTVNRHITDKTKAVQDILQVYHRSRKKLLGISAEVAALYGEAKELPPGSTPPFPNGRADRIHLVGTRTEVGILCTESLAEFLRQVAAACGIARPDVNCHYPRYLGAADQPQFADLGLPEFLGQALRLVDEALESHYQTIIVPNGGYKTISAYLTMIGILRALPIVYVFENSDRVLALPPLPMGLDRQRWREARNRFSLIDGQPFDSANPTYQRLPFPGLVEEQIGPSGVKHFGLSRLGYLFETEYVSSEGSELARFTHDTTLLRHLPNANQNDFQGMIERLAGIIDYVWIGDPLRHMVDHGQLHHFDLFQFAARLLNGLFDSRPGFLKPHEMFTLLGAVALHDCGHVVQEYDGRSLTFTEIRTYHHVLSYLRLQAGPALEAHGPDPYLSRSLYEYLMSGDETLPGCPWSLNWPDWTWEETWNRFLRAIATVGVYHRKSAPLNLGDPPAKFLGRVENLTDSAGTLRPITLLGDIDCGEMRIEPSRLRLLACLLRIIDCLDQQRSRTGPPQRVRLHLDDLKRSRQALRSRISSLESLEAAPETVRKLIEELKEELAESDNQEKHFKYKQRVEGVKLQSEGRCVFEISLDFVRGVNDDDRREAEGVIMGEIEGELTPAVLETLQAEGIKFLFKRRYEIPPKEPR